MVIVQLPQELLCGDLIYMYMWYRLGAQNGVILEAVTHYMQKVPLLYTLRTIYCNIQSTHTVFAYIMCDAHVLDA